MNVDRNTGDRSEGDAILMERLGEVFNDMNLQCLCKWDPQEILKQMSNNLSSESNDVVLCSLSLISSIFSTFSSMDVVCGGLVDVTTVLARPSNCLLQLMVQLLRDCKNQTVEYACVRAIADFISCDLTDSELINSLQLSNTGSAQRAYISVLLGIITKCTGKKDMFHETKDCMPCQKAKDTTDRKLDKIEIIVKLMLQDDSHTWLCSDDLSTVEIFLRLQLYLVKNASNGRLIIFTHHSFYISLLDKVWGNQDATITWLNMFRECLDYSNEIAPRNIVCMNRAQVSAAILSNLKEAPLINCGEGRIKCFGGICEVKENGGKGKSLIDNYLQMSVFRLALICLTTLSKTDLLSQQELNSKCELWREYFKLENFLSFDDDFTIEVMLCFLDIYLADKMEICKEIHPVDVFKQYFEYVHNDYQVLLDLLISNETCFLVYFTKLLKFLNSQDGQQLEDLKENFKMLHNQINKLHMKDQFPFNVKPLLNLMKRFV